jgi:hypothetical protein
MFPGQVERSYRQAATGACGRTVCDYHLVKLEPTAADPDRGAGRADPDRRRRIIADFRILTGVPVWLTTVQVRRLVRKSTVFTLAWLLAVLPRRSRPAE